MKDLRTWRTCVFDETPKKTKRKSLLFGDFSNAFHFKNIQIVTGIFDKFKEKLILCAHETDNKLNTLRV